MSKKKQGGKTDQHISPEGKRLGIKRTHGEEAAPGVILVRQRGTKFHAGEGVKVGRDHTLFAIKSGKVKFGRKTGNSVVSIISE